MHNEAFFLALNDPTGDWLGNTILVVGSLWIALFLVWYKQVTK